MITFSDQFLRIAVLVTNSLFIVSGVAVLSFGIYQNQTAADKQFDEYSSDGSVSIVLGCLDIIIGVCGMVGLLMKIRTLLMLNVALLSMSIVGNIIFLILYGVKMDRRILQVIEMERYQVMYYFGDYRSSHTKGVTWTVHTRQREYQCCGWTESDDENLYLKAPWYKYANQNVTGGKKLTLPDSCCVTLEDSCRTAVNVKEARDKGFVHKTNCLDLALRDVRSTLWIVVLQTVFRTLMQIACCVFSVMSWIQIS